MGYEIIADHECLSKSECKKMSKDELFDVIKDLEKSNRFLQIDLSHIKNDYDILKKALAIEQENVKTLASIITEFQPKEVQDDLATCQRGEWCDACAYHQIVRVDHGIGYGKRTEDVDICMKGLACKNFVNKSERED